MVKRLPGDTISEKLALNVRRDGECLRWTGAHSPKGYGQLFVDGRRVAVHRLAYLMAHGSIPDGYEVDHVRSAGCRWRDCVEPSHLEAVTHAENVRRALAAKTHCVRGHALTPENVKVGTRHKNGKALTVRRCRTCFNASRTSGRKVSDHVG